MVFITRDKIPKTQGKLFYHNTSRGKVRKLKQQKSTTISKQTTPWNLARNYFIIFRISTRLFASSTIYGKIERSY